MGHQDGRGAQTAENLRYLPSDLRSKFRVQAVERFVQKNRSWTG